MKQSFQRIVAWAKKHPLLTALILGAVVFLGYLAYRRANSGNSEGTGLQVGQAEEAGAGGGAADEAIPVPTVPGLESTPITFPGFDSFTLSSGGGGGKYKGGGGGGDFGSAGMPVTTTAEMLPPSGDLTADGQSFYTGELVSTPITQALAAGVPATLLGIPSISPALAKAMKAAPVRPTSTPDTRALMAGIPATVANALTTSQKKDAKKTTPKPNKKPPAIGSNAKPTLVSTPSTKALAKGVPTTVLSYMPKKK